ncbi:MAG: T9SS type A sorting domain-containing protein [Bacteroidales bacterium]
MKNLYSFRLISLFLTYVAFSLCISTTQAQGLPPHWESADIGAVTASGSVDFQDTVITITGSGADIWGVADAFHFLYQPAEGDCEIAAFVSPVTNPPTAPDAKLALMIRENITAGSPFVMAVACPGPGKGTYFQGRVTADAACTHFANLNASKPAPVWLKLIRRGNYFKSYYSEDGELWNTVDSVVIEMPFEVLIGLGVCAHIGTDALMEATFTRLNMNTGIEYPSSLNESTLNKLSVYPNPAKDLLYLQLSEGNFNANSFVLIHNSLGQLLHREVLAGNKSVLDISDIPQGIYYITVRGDQNIYVKKVIIE